MHLRGEKWWTHDGRTVIITADLFNEFVRVLNESGKLEVIHESYLKERKDEPSKGI